MKSGFKILLIEDTESFRGAVAQLLGVFNEVDEAPDLRSARALLARGVYDVVILDKGLPDGDGTELLSEIKRVSPRTVVIILTSDSDFAAVRHCVARGADDYVIKSANVVPELLVRIPVAVSKVAAVNRLANLEEQMREAFRYEIVGKAPSTIELRETILGLKGTNATVLITGETGTGKELVARRLNMIEDDSRRPFIALNCGAIAENLIESELFGHKKGAFTGAVTDRQGKFELADRGDLFLDEIGELPLHAQAKLLRALQEGEVTRVGDHRVLNVRCRVIAATNQNLEKMVREKNFREDLYHRLNVIRIATAPLRQRAEDIADLARLFVLQLGGSGYRVHERELRKLSEHPWPGNIRELRNAIERAVISARRRKSFDLQMADFVLDAPATDEGFRASAPGTALPATFSDLSPEAFRRFLFGLQKEYLHAALELSGGNAETVATALGLGRSTVFKKMKELGIGKTHAREKGTDA